MVDEIFFIKFWVYIITIPPHILLYNSRLIFFAILIISIKLINYFCIIKYYLHEFIYENSIGVCPRSSMYTWDNICLTNTQKTEEEELRDEIRIQALKNLKESMGKFDIDENGQRNNESFELTTKKGIVNLHTYMSKDSVKILMGRPESTSIDDSGYNGMVTETWKYKGTNKVFDEFTILFTNGKLKSVSQYKE